ncbi:sterol desaturase family protein [Paucibacter sp. JuS9]|uniref:sterol desaturase family protein n=1 Tax=Paucibacter sp. JuS9 TaxID=3228748 RepID=UPI0037584716
MTAVELAFLLFTPALYLLMLGVELARPARSFPSRSGWQCTGAGFLLLSMAIGNVLPLYLPLDWMAEHRWIDGSGLGVVGGTTVGFVVLELFVYVWHRSAHSFSPMWRAFHQIHHSPRRVDIPGALLFHPFETVAYTLIPLFVTVIVLGLDPMAAAFTGCLFGFYAFFQHWNIRTPQWLGYLIQRPESHCVHHRLGLHSYNFADLPLWDIVFGSFRNPKQFMGQCGFEGGRDQRLGAMLAFADVNTDLYGPGSRGVSPMGQGPKEPPAEFKPGP